jgi:type VI secretion system protein ImpK
MSYAPSLFGDNAPARCIPASTDAAFQARSLLDLLYDGFFMLFLLKNGRAPDSASEFSTKIQEFLSDFERGAKS